VVLDFAAELPIPNQGLEGVVCYCVYCLWQMSATWGRLDQKQNKILSLSTETAVEMALLLEVLEPLQMVLQGREFGLALTSRHPILTQR